MCATTISTSVKRVLVYDSGYTKWDESALCLLKKQFQCSPSNITILKVHRNSWERRNVAYMQPLMPQVLHLGKILSS